MPAFTGIGYHCVTSLFPWVAVGIAAFRMWGCLAWQLNLRTCMTSHAPTYRGQPTGASGRAVRAGSPWPYSSPELERVPIRDIDDTRAAVAYINSRYGLLGDGWQEWAGDKTPDLEVVFQTIDEWPIVYQRGDSPVFANPSRHGSLHYWSRPTTCTQLACIWAPMT